MTVKQRLIDFIGYKKISVRAFEIECGLSNGLVNNIKESISNLTLERISNAYPDLDKGWLLTGEGSMLKSENSNQKTNTMDDQKLLSHLMNEVEYLRKKLDESETERKELRSMCDKMLEDLREFTTPSAGRKKKEAI